MTTPSLDALGLFDGARDLRPPCTRSAPPSSPQGPRPLSGPYADVCTYLSIHRQERDPMYWAPPMQQRPQGEPKSHPGGAVGGWLGDQNMFDLANYMDQVDRQMRAFDGYVRQREKDKSPADFLEQGFFGQWATLFDAPDWGLNTTTGRPFGWRDFYAEHRGFLSRLLTDVSLWTVTERFEQELRRLHDYATNPGRNAPDLPIPPPTPGYQPPPPEQQPWEQVKEAAERVAKAVAVLGGIVAVGYVLHGLKR